MKTLIDTFFNYFWLYYAISFFYCVYKLNKSDKNRSVDGIIGTTPGFNLMISAMLGYVLMPVDLLVSLVFSIKRGFKVRKMNKLNS